MSGIVADLVADRRSGNEGGFRLAVQLRASEGITVVCGASGAGKSTLLLALAGVLRTVRGRVELDDRVLLDTARGVDVPTRRRKIGLVLQEAPLFSHLDGLRNVAFGLRGPRRSERARALLEHVGASALADRDVAGLSGGERQRVSLARALAPRPATLLLDEPFSALDTPARRSLGDLLVSLQAESGIPFVHVTHDLGEALRLGTRLVLLDGGEVIQSGPPTRVLARPESITAARAVGTENLLRGTVVRHVELEGCTEVDLGGTTVLSGPLPLEIGADVVLGLRAEEVLISLRPIRDTSARNVLEGTIEAVEPLGGAVELRVATPVPLRALVTPASVRDLELETGRRVFVLIKASAFQRLV